jgi:hypothetical protein
MGVVSVSEELQIPVASFQPQKLFWLQGLFCNALHIDSFVGCSVGLLVAVVSTTTASQNPLSPFQLHEASCLHCL